MHVLVTGGAGFIGSHLIPLLVSDEWQVNVLDDFSSGKMENLKGPMSSGGLTVFKGDIRDRRIVDKALKGVDAVVHLAGFVDPAASVDKPMETNDANVNGTLNMLDASHKARVKRFVFASSAGVYGDGNPLPLREEYSLRPLSPYAASKVSGEYYCKMFNDCYGLETVVLRFFNVYGPGQGANAYAGVITRFVQAGLHDEPLIVYGDGGQTRDFVYVGDVAKALVEALNSESSRGQVFNVCTGKQTSINDLALTVRSVLKKDLGIEHVEPRAGDVVHSCGDPSKAQKLLGFKAQVKFQEGLQFFIESVGANPHKSN